MGLFLFSLCCLLSANLVSVTKFPIMTKILKLGFGNFVLVI